MSTDQPEFGQNSFSIAIEQLQPNQMDQDLVIFQLKQAINSLHQKFEAQNNTLYRILYLIETGQINSPFFHQNSWITPQQENSNTSMSGSYPNFFPTDEFKFAPLMESGSNNADNISQVGDLSASSQFPGDNNRSTQFSFQQVPSDSHFAPSQVDDQSHYARGQLVSINNGGSLTDFHTELNPHPPNLRNESDATGVEQMEEEKKRPSKDTNPRVKTDYKEDLTKRFLTIFRLIRRILEKKLSKKIKAELDESIRKMISQVEECVKQLEQEQLEKKYSPLYEICISYNKKREALFFNDNECKAIFKRMVPILKALYRSETNKVRVLERLDERSNKYK